MISDKKYFKNRAMIENHKNEEYWFSGPKVLPVKDMIPTFENTHKNAITVNMLVNIPLFLATAGIGLQVKLMIFCLSINISNMLLMKAIMTNTGKPRENRLMKPNYTISSEYSSIVPFTSPSSYDCLIYSDSIFYTKMSSSLQLMSLSFFK